MPTRITRRELALGSLAATTLLAQSTPEKNTATMQDPRLDPVAWTRKRHASAPLKLTFNASNKTAAEAWQRKLRTKVVELVGGFPDSKGAPTEERVGTRELAGFHRQQFLFESRPGVAVSAYLLTPKN